jgi:hypothetical protein
MSVPGPKRQFAAVQRYGRCRWNTGRSVDVAETAAPDPERPFIWWCSRRNAGVLTSHARRPLVDSGRASSDQRAALSNGFGKSSRKLSEEYSMNEFVNAL